MFGTYHIHWLHPVKKSAACNRNIPTWACTSLGSEIGCYRCRKLNDAWIRKQLAKPAEL